MSKRLKLINNDWNFLVLFHCVQISIFFCHSTQKEIHQSERECRFSSANHISPFRTIFFSPGSPKKMASDSSDTTVKVPHMGWLPNFPVRYLRNRTMMGQGYGATQTRIIRENNPTMRYSIVCWTLCASFLSISNTYPAFRSIRNNGFQQQCGNVSIIELPLTDEAWEQKVKV